MEIKQKKEALETMTKQMALCGINQGYLDIRGLECTMVNTKMLRLNLKFKNKLTISLHYNEGADLYEAEVFKGTELIYKEERIFCEDWKNVFNRIWEKLI